MHKLSISDKGKYEMNNNFNKEQVYAIEFLGMDDEPLPYCYLEIVINGYPLSASLYKQMETEDGRFSQV